MVSGILVRAVAEMVMRYDVSPIDLVGSDSRTLVTRAPLDVRLPLQEFGRILVRAAELTGDQGIALHCGLDSSDSAFDLMAPLVSHVADLRNAIHEINQFHALAFDGGRILLREKLGVAELRCELPRFGDTSDRYVAEFIVGGFMRMLRVFGSTRRDLRVARFEHARPTRGFAYSKIFHARERFLQEFTGIEFAAEVLDRPHLLASPELQNAAHLQAEQRMQRLAHPDFIERLKAYLLQQSVPGMTAMAEVAREFGMSVRSMRRHLTVAGISYRTLTQDILGERACMLLRNRSFTIQRVAGTLGYADTGAFHRAFKRWKGMTAWEYRHSLASCSVSETALR
jgi:AraC-like DNA-binding protein